MSRATRGVPPAPPHGLSFHHSARLVPSSAVDPNADATEYGDKDLRDSTKCSQGGLTIAWLTWRGRDIPNRSDPKRLEPIRSGMETPWRFRSLLSLVMNACYASRPCTRHRRFLGIKLCMNGCTHGGPIFRSGIGEFSYSHEFWPPIRANATILVGRTSQLHPSPLSSLTPLSPHPPSSTLSNLPLIPPPPPCPPPSSPPPPPPLPPHSRSSPLLLALPLSHPL